MKKIHVFLMAALLTLCGVSMTAAILSLTGMGSVDHVTIPSTLSVEAGGTITLPVSLENSNANYVGFQMDIVLPQGVTPVTNARGNIVPTKTDRLGDTHSFSCVYETETNTIKMVCTSMSSETIWDTKGELFSVSLQTDASMQSGDYQLALTNVLFTTSSSAPEGAKGYSLPGATGILVVAGTTPTPTEKTWTVAGDTELMGSYWNPKDTQNDMTYYADTDNWTLMKQSVTLEKGRTYEYKVAANYSWDESYGSSDGGNASFTVEETAIYNVVFLFWPDRKTVFASVQKVGDVEQPAINTLSVPSQLSVEAGSSFSLPVSLANDNPNFVGFQMDIVLPQGVTPVTNARGNIVPTKTDRLGDTHSFSCNYLAESNTIKLVCSSLQSETILGSSGELFSIALQSDASMTEGEYSLALTNVLFTTSSSAPEGAVGYTLDDAYSMLNVTEPFDPNKKTIVIDFSTLGFDNASELPTLSIEGINFSFNIGSNGKNTPKYYSADKTVRMYAGNTMTLSTYQQIKKIIFGFNNTYTNAVLVDNGVLTDDTWVGETSQVTFTIDGTTGQRRFTTLTIVLTDIDRPQSFFDLNDAISQAQNVLNTASLTTEGNNLLSSAIATAQQALSTNDDATMTTAITTLNEVKERVLQQYALLKETIYITSPEGVVTYYDGTQSIDGQYSVMIPTPANGNTPYVSGQNLKWYSGNTLKISSILDIVSITFNASRNYTCSITTGQWSENNHWTGNTNEVTFTNDNGWTTTDISSLVITYEAPSMSILLSRLSDQISVAEGILQSLFNANVPGSSELTALVAAAKTATAETEVTVLANYSNQLKALTESVATLNQQYQTLAALLTQVETVAQNNDGADATVKAEALAKIQEARTGLNGGTYSIADIATMTQQMNSYYSVLSQVYLVINVEQAGTLSSLIIAKGFNLQDVKGLTVSGKLNSTDMQTIMNNLTSLEYLNMSETNITEIPSNQFYGRSYLKTVVLPKNLVTINDYAFYNCNNLQDVTFPTTLRTIGQYAFSYCYAIENVIIPEGVTSIGYRAFYNSTSTTWNETTQQNEYAAKMKTLSLPSTLTTMGNYAFAYNPNLQTVTFAEGITTISNYAFRYCYSLSELNLPNSLQSIGNYAFQYAQQLAAVTLPEGLQSIGNLAFGECQNLKTITCKNLVPLGLSNYVIGSSYDSQCTLYVPAVAVNAYKVADYWMYFQIQGTDIMPENIVVTSPTNFDWPATVGTDYKPNVRIDRQPSSTSEGAYGNLTMNGSTTVSMNNFSIKWDAYYSSYYTNYNSQTSSYDYNRYAYCSLIANTPMRADHVSVDLWTRSFNWDFLTFPFDVKVSDIVNNVQADVPLVIRRYDGQKRAEAKMGETWVDMTGDDILEAGKGYIWQSASDDQDSYMNNFYVPAQNNSKKNSIFANGDVEVQLDEYLSEFSQNRSWNLIGNPYPAYYDIRAMQTTAPITVWNKYNNVYQAYTPSEDAYILNPGQAFFVQRPLDQESITFLKEGRQTNQTVNADATYGSEAAGARAVAASERYVFNLLLSGSDETLGDRTRIVLNQEAMVDYEAGRDASKFMSFEANAAQLFTTQGSVRYAINERPLKDGIVELGLSIGTTGSYTIALSTKVDGEVYLIDRTLGTETRLDGTEGYTFQAAKGMMEGRFAIRFATGDATGISDVRSKMSEVRGDAYNLKGQRVANPTKGLYILNGKKAVVK